MPSSHNDSDEFIPIGEASRAAGVSISTLRRWETENRITVFRTPAGHRRYKRADVIAALTEQAAS
jgi:DNA-binding transcriptional MerR regulator